MCYIIYLRYICYCHKKKKMMSLIINLYNYTLKIKINTYHFYFHNWIADAILQKDTLYIYVISSVLYLSILSTLKKTEISCVIQILWKKNVYSDWS